MSGPERQLWTAGEKQRLSQLITVEGHNTASAAAVLGRSKGSVQTMMSHLRLHSSVQPEVRYAILERHSEDWRPSRIARQVGVAVHVVERVLACEAAKADATAKRNAEAEARRRAVRAQRAELMKQGPVDPITHQVLSILKAASGPIPARDIAAAVYGDSVRYPTDAVRSRVQALRGRGFPIVSTMAGYRLVGSVPA